MLQEQFGTAIEQWWNSYAGPRGCCEKFAIKQSKIKIRKSAINILKDNATLVAGCFFNDPCNKLELPERIVLKPCGRA